MRFSTGTEITYSADALGTAVLISGDPAHRLVAPTPLWRLDTETSDGTRTWRLPKGKSLTRLHRPVSPDYLKVLTAHLATLKPRQKHPALVNGLNSEAVRLYPDISAAAKTAFADFVTFLGQNFGLNSSAWEGEPTAPFTDDMGPELLVQVDTHIVPLPEMPVIYTAPTLWQSTMWTAANAMFGPYDDDELPPDKQISFMNVGDIPNAQSPEVEGLIYYQAARFITIFEAWVGNPDMPLLRKLIRLIMDGQRPWQTNILPPN